MPHRGEGYSRAPSPKRRKTFMDYIDVHAHGFPEAYLRQLAASYPTEVQVEEAAGTTPMVTRWSKAPLPAWDLERHLAEMDRDGVAVEILSAPPIYSDLKEDLHGLYRRTCTRLPGGLSATARRELSHGSPSRRGGRDNSDGDALVQSAPPGLGSRAPPGGDGPRWRRGGDFVGASNLFRSEGRPSWTISTYMHTASRRPICDSSPRAIPRKSK